MNKKSVIFLGALLLSFGALSNVCLVKNTTNNNAVIAEAVKGDDFTNHGQFTYTAGSCSVSILSESEMASEGVAKGYANEVLKMTGSGDNNILVDFNASNIPLTVIDKINIKVYAVGGVSGKKPEFRIKATNYSQRGLSEWPYLLNDGSEFSGDGGRSLKSVMETWYTFELNDSNLSKVGLRNLESETKPGMLGAFYIRHRCTAISDILYIDSIDVCLKENDHVGPVITYNGSDPLEVACKSVVVFDVSAYDEQEKCSKDVTTTWSPAQSFDGDGKVQNKGTFQVTFSSKDYYLNETTKNITVVVGDEDTAPPKIEIPFDTIKLKTGTKFIFDAERYVSDENPFTVEVEYSKGMLDVNSCLLAGTHTIKITAKDVAGNTSSKVINVIVSDDYSEEGIIKNENEYAIVLSYCKQYLGMDTVKETDSNYEQFCKNAYASAKEAYLILPITQKNIFVNDSDFTKMFSRLQYMADVNKEIFNGYTFESKPVDPDYAAVKNFCIQYLGMDTIKETDSNYDQFCKKAYASAKEAFIKLTDSQKKIFNTNSDFSSMITRLQKCVTLNGETFDGYIFRGNGSSSQNNNVALIFIIVGSVLVVAAA